MSANEPQPCPHALAALGVPAKRWATRAQLMALLKIAEGYLASCPVDEFSVGNAADAAGISRYHFLRLFRETYGKTPYRFLIEKRLEAAKAKLGENDSSIREISAEAGFVSPSAFARAFKREAGSSPSQWRRRALCETNGSS